MKKWVFSRLDKERASRIAQELNLPFFLATMLDIRGITEKDEIDAFLSFGTDAENFKKLTDLDKAVKRVWQAVDSFEKICIYGDYDADGITATALVYSYLESFGANVIYYIPTRDGEGYGLNNAAIDHLHSLGVQLIITVDNGIVSLDEVQHANDLGIDTIVTDHHQPRDILPDAVAVIDPHRKDCSMAFKAMSGVGVAFQFLVALEGEDGDFNRLIEDYSDLVAIGTVADVVPLKYENRFFVHQGIDRIINAERLGVRALLEECGFLGQKINTNNLAFSLIPRINASGRMASASKTVQLLLSEDPEEAEQLAREMSEQNQNRRDIEKDIIREVEELFEKKPEMLYQRILIIDGEDWHHGVIGIVASRITEKYGKPCIVISRTGDIAKGSGRSVEGFSLYEAILSCSKYFTRFGGHPMAVGINLNSCYIEDLRRDINAYAAAQGEMPHTCLQVDCKLNPKAISAELIRPLAQLEPYGQDNPKPVFAVCNLRLKEICPVAGGKHLRLTFERDKTSLSMMLFSTTKEDFLFDIGDTLDVAATIELSEYLSVESLSFIIKDIRLPFVDIDEMVRQRDLYEQFKRGEELSPEALEGFLPSREEFAAVYRYLRKNHSRKLRIDIIYHRLQIKSLNFCKIAVIFDVLAEMQLITFKKDADIYSVKLNPAAQKVDLNNSQILKSLKLEEEQYV